jgi:thiol-disulfide isomerase/thioredoxin
MRENKKKILLVLFILLILLGLFFVNKPRALPELEFNILDDDKLLSKNLEDKIVIINFWATDCSTCIKEMPILTKIHDKYKNDIELIAVAMPYDLPSRVINFKDKNQIPFKIALDSDGKILEKFNKVRLTPTTIITNKQQIIQNTIIGEINYQNLDKLIDSLR